MNGISETAMMTKSLQTDLEAHGLPKHLMSYSETMINLMKGMCGAGLFAMGDAFKNGGIIVAPIFTVILGAIAIHCEHLLVNSSRKVRQRTKSTHYFDYPETAQKCFENGPLVLRIYSSFVKSIIQFFICVTQLAFCCIYFVFITENLEQVILYNYKTYISKLFNQQQ